MNCCYVFGNSGYKDKKPHFEISVKLRIFEPHIDLFPKKIVFDPIY
jgi:hypothetical protein